jgi:prepilin-type N-terminal cleavage/methylation domain-containing protein
VGTRPRRRRIRERGFTLFELLVAVSIAGVAVSATYAVFSAGIRAREVMRTRHEQGMQARYVHTALETMLGSVSSATHAIEGGSSELTLFQRSDSGPTDPATGPPADVSTDRSGQDEQEIPVLHLGPSSRGLSLVADRRGLDAEDMALAASQNPPPAIQDHGESAGGDGVVGGADGADEAPAPMLLETPLELVAIGYLDAEGAWQASWDAGDALPQAIRIALRSFSESIQATVVVPGGSGPPGAEGAHASTADHVFRVDLPAVQVWP